MHSTWELTLHAGNGPPEVVMRTAAEQLAQLRFPQAAPPQGVLPLATGLRDQVAKIAHVAKPWEVPCSTMGSLLKSLRPEVRCWWLLAWAQAQKTGIRMTAGLI